MRVLAMLQEVQRQERQERQGQVRSRPWKKLMSSLESQKAPEDIVSLAKS
jgi:hypothetical protein